MCRRDVLAALALAMAILAIPTAATGQAPAQDSVVGSGTAGEFRFDLNARSGPSGENPAGSALVGVLGSSVMTVGPVTCLTVSGSRAVIGFEDTLDFPRTISGGFIEVADGTPDSFGFVLLDHVPTVCPASVTELQPVVSGDIVVTDAQPFPTSKDQCKNGGWRSFGVFKNQGDCVSFVALGGRNAPANNPPSPSQ